MIADSQQLIQLNQLHLQILLNELSYVRSFINSQSLEDGFILFAQSQRRRYRLSVGIPETREKIRLMNRYILNVTCGLVDSSKHR